MTIPFPSIRRSLGRDETWFKGHVALKNRCSQGSISFAQGLSSILVSTRRIVGNRVILLLDNYDSFVFNLARYFERLGQTTHVVRNDAIDAAGVRALAPAAVVLSPGPCTPEQAGCSLDLVRELHAEIPMLGVCLGHQSIAAALGGQVVRAAEPVHGRSSNVFHDSRGVFQDLPNPLTVCRYHSLIVDEASLPDILQVTARTADGVVMALQHRLFPVIGVQFHPESILTQQGYELLANFLHLAGIELPAPLPDLTLELDEPRAEPFVLPKTPITF
jgi:anthranilate synthase/aminodeoxychorismate synthase-like glutamine amidotransferase